MKTKKQLILIVVIVLSGLVLAGITVYFTVFYVSPKRKDAMLRYYYDIENVTEVTGSVTGYNVYDNIIAVTISQGNGNSIRMSITRTDHKSLCDNGFDIEDPNVVYKFDVFEKIWWDGWEPLICGVRTSSGDILLNTELGRANVYEWVKSIL